ncbi:hypothetical protein SETIT_3G200900v2 [Setaria italica]|uniref:DUF1618 domain-containing protein n=1 Tax=Setaria italica TaxID=4555 RepID=A0A368QH21_SETIT|nr:hypothetical protein SETIT_3G200900v2 [Setaria italica]
MSSEGTEASPPQADPEEARAETEARRRVVLASVPVFLRKKQAQQEIPPGADFGVVFHQRPRPSYLVLLKSFAPDCEPNVIAVVAHRSGRLLLQATAGEPCFLFDAETRAATRLPPSPTTSASTSSRGAAWDSSPIDAWQATTWPPSSSPRRPRATAPSFATPPSPSSRHRLRHARLRPLRRPAARPRLRFVPHPFDRDEDDPLDHGRRCVCASEGKLRYAEISSIAHNPAVRFWTLLPDAQWKSEYEVGLTEIWKGKGGRQILRKKEELRVAFVDPYNVRVWYFVQGMWVFQVDLPARKIMRRFQMEGASPSRKLLAWKIPISVSEETHARGEAMHANQTVSSGDAPGAIGARHYCQDGSR